MKTKFLLISSLILALTSCMPSHYYQVYKAKPDTQIETKSDFLVYENQNCKVSYNLWQENGNVGFAFYNKTENDIILYLDESFFVLNGMAFPYYQNRIFGTSSKANTTVNYSYWNYFLIGASTVNTTSSAYSVARIEKKKLTIPSKTSIIIAEFSINKDLIRNCDLFRYPRKKEITTVSFNKTNSPIIFSNRISYSLENSPELIEIENNFYVSEITNYPENKMFDYKDEEFCGEETLDNVKYSTKQAPNKFYIKYPRDNYSNLEH